MIYFNKTFVQRQMDCKLGRGVKCLGKEEVVKKLFSDNEENLHQEPLNLLIQAIIEEWSSVLEAAVGSGSEGTGQLPESANEKSSLITEVHFHYFDQTEFKRCCSCHSGGKLANSVSRGFEKKVKVEFGLDDLRAHQQNLWWLCDTRKILTVIPTVHFKGSVCCIGGHLMGNDLTEQVQLKWDNTILNVLKPIKEAPDIRAWIKRDALLVIQVHTLLSCILLFLLQKGEIIQPLMDFFSMAVHLRSAVWFPLYFLVMIANS